MEIFLKLTRKGMCSWQAVMSLWSVDINKHKEFKFDDDRTSCEVITLCDSNFNTWKASYNNGWLERLNKTSCSVFSECKNYPQRKFKVMKNIQSVRILISIQKQYGRCYSSDGVLY